MPELSGTVLQELHGHPRDARITFKEEGHTYTIDGESGHYTSVTTLIHKFFPHFDADGVIAKITQSKRSAYYGMDPQDIKDQWARATQDGSDLHEQIELFFDQYAGLGEVVPEMVAPSVEFGFFLDYFRDHCLGKMRPYRSEWYVFDEDEDVRVCGSIDMLFSDIADETNRRLFIVDWKRSKEIRTRNVFEKGYGPCSHYDSCNHVQYSLQLNLYKYILEAKYDKVIVGMMLVILHPTNKTYKLFPVADMQADIHRMLASKDNPKGEGSSAVFRGNASKYLSIVSGEGVSVVSAMDHGITTTTTTTYQEKENTTDRGGLRMMQGNAMKYLTSLATTTLTKKTTTDQGTDRGMRGNANKYGTADVGQTMQGNAKKYLL
jgi:hypothetical protein